MQEILEAYRVLSNPEKRRKYNQETFGETERVFKTFTLTPENEEENTGSLFNTGLSPAWDEAAFTEWLEGDNLCFCDTIGALGGEQLLNHPHVRCMQVSTGRTRQAFDRLSAKVLANLSEYNG